VARALKAMGGGAKVTQIVASWLKKRVANAKAVFGLFVCIHRLLLSFVFRFLARLACGGCLLFSLNLALR